MDCRVVVEAAVPVYDVESTDEAVRIAISKTGAMLNPDLSYVEITMGERVCPHCHESLDPAFVAADESLVALELEMTVFNVEREEHASRIARKEIGGQLDDIPLEVISVEVIEESEGDDAAGDTEDAAGDTDDEAADSDESAADADGSAADADDSVADAVEPDLDADLESDDAPDAAVPSSESEGENGDDDGESSDDDQVLPEFEDLID
jgi:uncharacterized protein (UPF0212 family)